MYNKEFDLLDLIGILSFLISLLNLDVNLTQTDKQELLESLSKQTGTLLQEIHEHLDSQDKKIDMILEELKNA